MITVRVRDRDVYAIPLWPITTGSVGLPVAFDFDKAWDGLNRIAVFRGSDTDVEVALLTDACVVPPEVLTVAGGNLYIGVYGRDAYGTTVIPTIWGKAGHIYDGTEPEDPDPADPTPEWSYQVQQAAAEALRIAQGVAADAEAGEFDGEDGQDGFSPAVTVTEIEGGHQINITDAEHPVEGQTFVVPNGATGPQGPKGDTGESGEVQYADIAPVFSTSSSYKAGDYVFYDGSLYCFTADHAAGEWTGTDASAAKIADALSDVKSTFVMPESFGAKSDWNTDDTEAIQAAIDYAVDNHIFTVLLSGAYRITEPLKIPPGFRLMGHANGYGTQKKQGYLKVDGCSAISFSLADTALADGSHVFACAGSSIENIHFLQINNSSPFITFHGTGSESLSSVQIMNGGIKNCNIKGFSSFCGPIGFQAFDISNMAFILPKFGSGLRISDCHWNNWFFSSSGLGLLYSSSSPVFESAFIRASHLSNMFFTGDTTAPSAGPNCCLRICGASAFSLDNIVFDYYPARALSFEQGSGPEYNNGISASNLMFRGCSTEQYSAINIEYAKNLHFDKVIFKNTHITGFAPKNLFASISSNAYNENIYADGFEQESDYKTGSIDGIIFKFTTFTHSNMGYEKRSANTKFVKKSIYATVPANGTVRAAPSDIGSIPFTVVRLYTDGLPEGVNVIQVEPIGAKVYLTYSNSTFSDIQMSGAVLGIIYETMY